MSDTSTVVPRTRPGAPAQQRPDHRSASRRRLVTAMLAVLALFVLVGVPQYLDGTWLIIGILGMAAATAAIGLTILTGTSGQLSVAQAFFLAIGAYGYAFLAGEPVDEGATGLGLPPVLAFIGAIGLAGLAGLLFSPVAARLRGLYLGVASLGLVFLGDHVLANADRLTGGYNGRVVPPLSVGGFELTGSEPDLFVLGVEYGARERLWYVVLVALLLALVAGRRIVRGRPGRALQLLRDSPAAAASMGVNGDRMRASVFAVSSMFAGAGGVLTALAFEYVVPQYFGLTLSLLFLAMVVIGGLGSVGGAVAGALLVTMLPLLLERFSSSLTFLDAPGSGGFDPATVSRLVFGLAVVLVIVLEPRGLAGIGARLSRRLRTFSPSRAQR